jgi:hypothetical protein
MSNHEPRRVQAAAPQGTARKFAPDRRAEANLALDADPTLETDLALAQSAREDAQERYRNAGTEEERGELTDEIEELSPTRSCLLGRWRRLRQTGACTRPSKRALGAASPSPR